MNFFRNGYAHAIRISSKPSQRRSSWSKPHLIGCPVCGVIRANFQHPKRGDGLARGQREKSFSTLFSSGIGWMKFIFVLCCEGSGAQQWQRLSSIPPSLLRFKTAAPIMPHASGRSPRGGDRHGPNHTSSGCVWRYQS